MQRTRDTLVATLLGLAACTGDVGPQGAPGPAGESDVVDPTLDPVEKAFVGIGGKDSVVGLTGFRYQVEGSRYFPGEEYRPEDAPMLAHRYTGTFTYDVTADASRFDVMRTVQIFGTDVQHSFSELVRGNLGHVSGDDGLFGGSAGDLFSAGTAAIRKERRLENPQLILREIAANPSIARVGGVAVLDGSLHQLVEVADPIYPITLYVNARTGRIAKATTLENDYLFRDVELTAFYSDWQAADGGPAFPRQVTLAVEDDVILNETRTAVEANPAIDAASLEMPADAHPTYDDVNAQVGRLQSHFHQGFASFGFRIDFVQDHVEASQLAPGVYRLGGGTHNSLVVEQTNGIVLIDAPLYTARTEALLAWIAQQFPTKPVTHVICTHFHDDHVGGLRAIAARDIPIITGAGTEGLLEAGFAAPATVAPDALSQHPVETRITRIGSASTLRLPDATRPIDIVPVPNGHAIDMVMARLPNQHVIFEADLWSPGFPPGVLPRSLPESLYTAIVARSFQADTIVGAHGGVGTFAELAAVAGH